MEFKTGDRVTKYRLLKKDNRTIISQVGWVGTVMGEGITYSGGPTTEVKWDNYAWTTHTYTNELQLVNKITKNNMRKRYILLKDGSIYKKGAIFEEMCDSGDQDFQVVEGTLQNKLFESLSTRFSRVVITNSPEWYQEVQPLYVPANKIEAVKKFVNKLK